MIGASVDWYISPRWKVAGYIEDMDARIRNIDGHAIVAMASTDYMLTRNLGIGVRYMYSNVSADVEKTNFNGAFEWQMNSVSLYAKLVF